MTSEWAFLVDETLNSDIAAAIRREGYEAEHVTEALEAGADDTEDILPYVTEQDHLLITHDRDFSALPHEAHPGILMLYDRAPAPAAVAAAVTDLVEAYGDRDRLRHREALDRWL